MWQMALSSFLSALFGYFVGDLGQFLSRPKLEVGLDLLPLPRRNLDTARLKPVQLAREPKGERVIRGIYYFLPLICHGRSNALDCDLPQIFLRTPDNRLMATGPTFWNAHPDGSRTIAPKSRTAQFCVCLLDQDNERVRVWHYDKGWIAVVGRTFSIAIAPSSSNASCRDALLEFSLEGNATTGKVVLQNWSVIKGGIP